MTTTRGLPQYPGRSLTPQRESPQRNRSPQAKRNACPRLAPRLSVAPADPWTPWRAFWRESEGSGCSPSVLFPRRPRFLVQLSQRLHPVPGWRRTVVPLGTRTDDRTGVEDSRLEGAGRVGRSAGCLGGLLLRTGL